ncbi:MAG TPA: hypothetical protein PKL63_11025 [Dermatophilaceae bacterium]|nr:hypothetical protein [Dermatophilaceae bacterium]HOF35832.1 hypothetical protein [Dermatophilaceae bacterium]
MSSEPEPEPEPEPELSSEPEPELSSKLSESSEVEEDELVEALEDDRDEVLDDDPVVLEDEALVLDEVDVRGRSPPWSSPGSAVRVVRSPPWSSPGSAVRVVRSPPLSSAVPAGVLDELLTSCTEAGTAVGNDWANDSLPSNPRAAGTTAAVAAIAITMRFMVGSLQVVGRGGPATT